MRNVLENDQIKCLQLVNIPGLEKQTINEDPVHRSD